MKYISDYYISNCLIEAVKAKFKDWRNVEFKIFLPSFAGSFHIAWTDRKHDYDFLSDDALPAWKAYSLHRGRIRRLPAGTFDRRIQFQKAINLAQKKFEEGT